MILLPYGPRAVLAEFDSTAEVLSAAREWRSRGWAAVVDIVPAARTVLVVHDGTFDPSVLAPVAEAEEAAEGPLVELPVAYDGADLHAVADAVGVTVEEVVALHSAPVYRAAFCGFMPGFAYLVGTPPVLHLPRRDTPRERVPAGSVAIAGGYSGVYPQESPGGWHLLGRTDRALWDEAWDVPALLAPGTRVRFVPR